MGPQTTICVAFNDTIFSGTPYKNVLPNELFRFLDARWLCQVGRNMSVRSRTKWGQSRTVSCSGGIIGM